MVCFLSMAPSAVSISKLLWERSNGRVWRQNRHVSANEKIFAEWRIFKRALAKEKKTMMEKKIMHIVIEGPELTSVNFNEILDVFIKN